MTGILAKLRSFWTSKRFVYHPIEIQIRKFVVIIGILVGLYFGLNILVEVLDFLHRLSKILVDLYITVFDLALDLFLIAFRPIFGLLGVIFSAVLRVLAFIFMPISYLVNKMFNLSLEKFIGKLNYSLE